MKRVLVKIARPAAAAAAVTVEGEIVAVVVVGVVAAAAVVAAVDIEVAGNFFRQRFSRPPFVNGGLSFWI
jgi:hypothetical protein